MTINVKMDFVAPELSVCVKLSVIKQANWKISIEPRTMPHQKDDKVLDLDLKDVILSGLL